MFGKLLLGATLTTVTLAASPLFADPGHQHGQNTACTENCPSTPPQTHGMRGMGGMHARMQTMHGDAQGKAPQGMHGGKGMQHGKQGDGCPMQGGHKPT